jgi:hypothetical protein
MKKIIIIALSMALLMPTVSTYASTKSIKTKGNRVACKDIKTNYNSEIMSKWVNGLASDDDVLKEIQSNIEMIIFKQKPTSGKIKAITSSWINVEKNTKIALINKDVEATTFAMNLKINTITQFNKLCKSIEK